MFQYWTFLAVTLMTCVEPSAGAGAGAGTGAGALDVAVILQITTSAANYTVIIYTNVLEQFHQCLCERQKFFCSLELTPGPSTSSVASFRQGANSQINRVYSHDYECSVDFHQDFHQDELGTISCFRLVNAIKPQYLLSWSPPCQIFRIKNTSPPTCDLDCVGIMWRSHNVTVTYTQSEELSCGLCGETESTSMSSTAVKAVSSTVTANEGNSSDGTNDTTLIVGVVIGVIFVFLIPLIVLVIVRWKRSRLETPYSNVDSHYVNTASKSDTQSPCCQVCHTHTDTQSPYSYVDHTHTDTQSPYSHVGHIHTDTCPCPAAVYESLRENANTENPESRYDYISVGPAVSQGDTGGSAEGQMYANSRTASSEKATNISSVSNVYAKLHEDTRKIQHPYDVLGSHEDFPHVQAPGQRQSSRIHPAETYHVEEPVEVGIVNTSFAPNVYAKLHEEPRNIQHPYDVLPTMEQFPSSSSLLEVHPSSACQTEANYSLIEATGSSQEASDNIMKIDVKRSGRNDQ